MNGGTITASASTSTASSSGNEGIRAGISGFGVGKGIGGATTTAAVATVPVGGESGEPGGKKKKAPKRRKVNHACLYCRRSHMTCDEGRPCQRCIKREIGHLCHDEQRPSKQDRHASQPLTETAGATTTLNPPAALTSRSITPTTVPGSVTGTGTVPTTLPYLVQPQAQAQVDAQPSLYYAGYGYGGEAFGSEFSMLSDFLETLDDSTFFSTSTTGATLSPTLMFTSYAPPASTTTGTTATSGGFAASGSTTTTTTTIQAPSTTTTTASINGVPPTITSTIITSAGATPNSNTEADTEDASTPSTSNQLSASSSDPAIKTEDDETQLTLPLPAPTKTEKFFLTAADQDSGSRDERLSRVIRSKYEAGLLKPYNYVKGYARLSRWMDVNVSQESKRQILQPLSVLRPKFRAIAQSLRDIDLVFIEEAFERLLLDYDRVFSAMGVPACLWRRTGEIYKGNREFSQLVGVDGYLMREGRLCIYELMAEESAVNYWEKYGNVAFDSSQKAVLTSCVLRYKPLLSVGGGGGSSSSTTAAGPGPGGQVVGAGLGSRFGYPAPMLPPSNSSNSGNKNVSGMSGDGAGAGDAGDAGGGVSENATGTGTSGGAEDVDDQMKEAGLINCCFSFTIRRDKWGIPSMIVGNFIRC